MGCKKISKLSPNKYFKLVTDEISPNNENHTQLMTYPDIKRSIAWRKQRQLGMLIVKIQANNMLTVQFVLNKITVNTNSEGGIFNGPNTSVNKEKYRCIRKTDSIKLIALFLFIQ